MPGRSVTGGFAPGDFAKTSIGLSLALLVALALLIWPGTEPQTARPVLAPPQQTKPADLKPETPKVERPVVLPPPPLLAEPTPAAPAQAAAPNRPAKAEPGSEPPKAVAALKPRPVANRPPPTKTVTALRPPSAAPPPPKVPRIERDEPEPVAAPTPPQSAVPEPPPVTVQANAEVVREGRTLLRLLEHGSGPIIELAWPDSANARARLYRRLRDCFGMRIALMDRRERLFTAQGSAGAPWQLNLDRYSGFIRYPAGRMAQGEAEAGARIRRHHGGLTGARTVRVFPRRLDALLLGGLSRIVGADYAARQTIRARYDLEGGRLSVRQVEADGRALPGRIDLSAAGSRACRPAAT